MGDRGVALRDSKSSPAMRCEFLPAFDACSSDIHFHSLREETQSLVQPYIRAIGTHITSSLLGEGPLDVSVLVSIGCESVLH